VLRVRADRACGARPGPPPARLGSSTRAAPRSPAVRRRPASREHTMMRYIRRLMTGGRVAVAAAALLAFAAPAGAVKERGKAWDASTLDIPTVSQMAPVDPV